MPGQCVLLRDDNRSNASRFFCFVSFFFERGQGKRAKGHLGVEIGERERETKIQTDGETGKMGERDHKRGNEREP